MSSLIEQATKRLEQLRRAGVDLENNAQPTSIIKLDDGLSNTEDASVKPITSPDFPKKTTSVSRKVDLDLDAIAAAGIVSPNAPRSQIADQYRVIKRPLITNAMGRGASTIENGNLIMVTSALAGEGKSFSAINLAMSIATELDNTVMLVDADVARPSVLRMLGLPASPGLLDLLVGDVEDLSSVLLKTNIDKLTLLPSGTPHLRATELLASDAMSQLIKNIANRYSDRIIIFDSPPLLLTTESRVLATHMGQIVMVVHAEKTLQADVQHALSSIEACPVKLMVLNQARSGSQGGYGGYGGYGYGYGQQST
ncbi:exopolysaccharide/PEP-CTERM locus tyrosine autokinase [Rhodoferax ferrireducens]|uniref:non-specific protein-tyrosine kinase n=1 Tax=Rhodoferax ferrireducens TaxID=192843 RepID=A0ABU2C7K9_9BURK|nr:XrtA-associated tyrosine autokinase [Rhodoferax ferrireducens]MDR7377281.1 exopolysaccharide/PEP-CTERM locus tyrosine autokinase [Rhodoferax ferrireducens]